MSFLSRVVAAIQRRTPTVPAPESPRYHAPIWAGQFGRIPSDLFLTVDQQLAVSVAWACIRAIVDPIAASEIAVYEETDGRREDDPEGWLFQLLNITPHPQYTSQGWSETMLTRAVATGNAYAYLRRDGTNRVVSMQPLDPNLMLADDNGAGGVTYRYQDPQNGEVRMPESDVLHVRGPRTGGFYGDSPLARSSAALALAKAQEDYATAYYSNGAYPGVLLKPPADMRGTPSREERATLREAWKALFGGPRRANGLATLDPGWDLEVVATDAEKSQMVEARRWQVTEICRYFGVPGHLVGVPEASQGYGKNLAELGNGFVRQTLKPWARRVEEEFKRKLLPIRRSQSRTFIEYDLEWLTRGDEESVARAAEIDLRNGVLTINEVRAKRGLPSIDGGDEVLVNGKPLEMILEPPAPPAAAAPPSEDGEDAADGAEPAETEDEPAGREALAAFLGRHLRRVKARTADLLNTGKDDKAVAAHVERLREKARAEMRQVVIDLSPEALDLALVSVEQGAPPDKAALSLLGAA